MEYEAKLRAVSDIQKELRKATKELSEVKSRIKSYTATSEYMRYDADLPDDDDTITLVTVDKDHRLPQDGHDEYAESNAVLQTPANGARPTRDPRQSSTAREARIALPDEVEPISVTSWVEAHQGEHIVETPKEDRLLAPPPPPPAQHPRIVEDYPSSLARSVTSLIIS